MPALVSAPTTAPGIHNMSKGKGRAEAVSGFATSACLDGSSTTLAQLVQDHQEQYHYNIGRAQNNLRRPSAYNSETAPVVPLIPVPENSTAGGSHCSRSSISSTASHIIFSPDRSAQPAVVLETPLSDYQRRERVNEERKHLGLPPLTPPTPDPYDTPAVKMPVPYISHLSSYLAEMIVYLWYSPPKFKRGLPFPKPSTGFIKFCHDTLLTTQLSQSVVVLALFFIWKLQSKHCIDPAPGSEFKLAVVSLMLANKVLDDHTYTNRTWSEVTNMPLRDLNDSEKEFLQGLDFSLYVSRTAFSAWVELLERPDTAAFHPSSRHRKRPRVEKAAPTIAPSAPTSPIHPSSASSSSRTFAFDFAVYNPSTSQSTYPPHDQQQQYQQQAAYQVAAPSVSSSSASQMLTVPQANAPYPVQQQQRQQAPGSSPFSYTQSAAVQSSLAPHAAFSARKKRKLSNPSLPAEFFYERRPSSAQTPVQGWQTQAAGLPYPDNSTAVYPIDATAQAQQMAATSGVNLSVTDVDQGADFSTLTSKFSPVDELVGRNNPESLAYYALAAGQQRGGILAYQPVGQHAPGFTPAVAYHQNSAAGSGASLYVPEQHQRQIAALPHHSQQYSQQGGLQSSTALAPVYASMNDSNSYSLSPGMVRSSSYVGDVQSQGMAAPLPSHSGLSLPPPSMQYQDASRQYQTSMPEHAHQQIYQSEYVDTSTQSSSDAYAAPAYYAGEYDRHCQNTAPAPPTVQNAVPTGAAPTYYSSFSNNGLPGVVQWPTKYASVVGNASHLQVPTTAWPRQPGYIY